MRRTVKGRGRQWNPDAAKWTTPNGSVVLVRLSEWPNGRVYAMQNNKTAGRVS